MKILMGFLLIAVVSSLTVGFVVYNIISRYETDNLKSKLKMTANTAARSINAEEHLKLKQDGEESPAYKKMLQELREYVKIAEVSYLYTFVPLNDEKVAFVLDTDESADRANIGDEYPMEKEIKSAFQGNIAVTEEAVDDDWGTFYTGFAPILDSKGKVTAIVGADLSIDAVKQIQQKIKFLVGCCVKEKLHTAVFIYRIIYIVVYSLNPVFTGF